MSVAVAAQGWELVDADEIGREVVNSDQDVLRKLVNAFGADVVDADGKLVRSLVAKRTFGDPRGTGTLNSIVHTALISRLKSQIETIRLSDGDAVVDCALVFEWGIEDDFDLVICVHAPQEIRKARIINRDGRSPVEVEGMFRAQLPEDEKIRRSQIAIANNGAAEKMKAYGEMIATLPRLLSGDV